MLIAEKARLWLTYCLIAVYYSNLVGFQGDRGMSTRISPYVAELALMGVVLLTLVTDPRPLVRVLDSALLLWSLAYVAIISVGMLRAAWTPPIGIDHYLFVRGYAINVTEIMFLITACIILYGPHALIAARKAIVVSTLVAVALNIYDTIHPMTFSVSMGRAAGLWVNSNESGLALGVGLLLGMPALRPRYREPYALVTIVGLVLTQSRAAILVFIVVSAALWWQHQLRVRKLMRLVLITTACGILLIASDQEKVYRLERRLAASNVLSAQALKRLMLNMGDSSIASRKRIAEEGLLLAQRHPLVGSGFHSTYYWERRISTHDLYINLIADNGILIGGLVIPCLLLTVIPFTAEGVGFAVVYLLWGFVSHNSFDDMFLMIALAIEANVSWIRRSSSAAAVSMPNIVPQAHASGC